MKNSPAPVGPTKRNRLYSLDRIGPVGLAIIEYRLTALTCYFLTTSFFVFYVLYTRKIQIMSRDEAFFSFYSALYI